MARKSKGVSDADHDWTSRAERMRIAAEQMPFGAARVDAMRLARELKAAAVMRVALESGE